MLTLIKNLVAILKAHFGITSIKSQKGVTMVEYALMASLIAVAAIAVLTGTGSLSEALNAAFTSIKDAL